MIPIQNVYYMLSYAFQVLNEQGYKNIATEQFHNVAELCAAILIKGVSLQIKRGLERAYVSETDTLSGIRGKIDLTESIKTQTLLRWFALMMNFQWIPIGIESLKPPS